MSLESICLRSLPNPSHRLCDLSLFPGGVRSHYLLVVWIAALLWLVRRSQFLLSRPRSELVDRLGLTEPVIPRIALDGLGDTWVSINWHYPSTSNSRSRRPRVRKHVIMVDGRIHEFERDQRRAHISHLQPGKTYTITVQAVQTNADNSLILSQTINAAAVNNTSPDQLLGGITPNIPTSNVALGISQPIVFQTFHSEKDFEPSLEAMIKADIPKFQKAELDKIKTLIAVQEETKEVLSNLTSTENQFLVKQKKLKQDCSDLNASRKSDEAQRTLIRIENKNLEDENHALEVQISKTKLQAAKIAKFNAEFEQESLRIANLEKLRLEREAENEALLDRLSRKVEELRERETTLIKEVKRENQGSRDSDLNGERAHTLIQNLKKLIFNASLEEKLVFLHSKEAEGLGPEAVAQIERELKLDNRIEQEWARAQKALEQQYVDAYLNNFEQKAQPSRQQQQQLHHEQVSMPQIVVSASLGTNSQDLFYGFGSNTNLSLMAPSATNRSHSGHITLANSSSLPSLNLSSHQSAHSTASLTSIQSLGSMQGVYPTSANSMNSVPSITPSHYDPFSDRQSSVSSLAPSSCPGSISRSHGNSTMSLSAADNLLPSNLFQDCLTNKTSTPGQKQEKMLEEQAHSQSKQREAAWLPWCMPQGKSPSSRRTTSLFFGNHADNLRSDSESSSIVEKKDDLFEEHCPTANESGTTQSPSKGVGSRIFQKGGHRTGSFVRRLSIFTRKEMEAKQDAESSQPELSC